MLANHVTLALPPAWLFERLGGALAGEQKKYCSGQNPAAKINVYTSRFGIFFGNSQTCRRIISTARGNIFHAAQSSQMPYTAKFKKSIILILKFEIP